MENVAQKNEKSISGAIKVNEKEVMEHLDGLVRKSVEDTLNTLLNEEADAICNAGRYQRSPDRLCNEFSVKSQREPVRGGT